MPKKKKRHDFHVNVAINQKKEGRAVICEFAKDYYIIYE
jgi:hypothetical protein